MQKYSVNMLFKIYYNRMDFLLNNGEFVQYWAWADPFQYHKIPSMTKKKNLPELIEAITSFSPSQEENEIKETSTQKTDQSYFSILQAQWLQQSPLLSRLEHVYNSKRETENNKREKRESGEVWIKRQFAQDVGKPRFIQ